MALGMEEEIDFEHEDTIFKVGEKDAPELDPSLLVEFRRAEKEGRGRVRETTGGTIVQDREKEGDEGSKGKKWGRRKGKDLVDAKLVLKEGEIVGRVSLDEGSIGLAGSASGFGSTSAFGAVDVGGRDEGSIGKGKRKEKKGLMSKLGLKKKGDRHSDSSFKSSPLYNRPSDPSFLNMSGNSQVPLAPIEVSPFAYNIAAGSLRSASSSRSNINLTLGTAVETIDPITGKTTRGRFNEEIDRYLPREEPIPFPTRSRPPASAIGGRQSNENQITWSEDDRGGVANASYTTGNTPALDLATTVAQQLVGAPAGESMRAIVTEYLRAPGPARILPKVMQILGEDAETIRETPLLDLEPSVPPTRDEGLGRPSTTSATPPSRQDHSSGRPLTGQPLSSRKKSSYATPSRPSALSETSSSQSIISSQMSSLHSSSSSHTRPILDQPSTGTSTFIPNAHIPIPDGPSLPPPARTSDEITRALLSALLPPFPTSIPRIETITTMTSTCMKRSAPPFSPAPPIPTNLEPGKISPIKSFTNFGRPSTSAGSGGGKKEKITWSSHKIILTIIKINEPVPKGSPDSWEEEIRKREAAKRGKEVEKEVEKIVDPDPERTIAHLHLFAIPDTSVKGSRPGTGSIFSSGGSGKKRPTTSPGLYAFDGQGEEVDRRPINGDTIAGVWDAAVGIGWDEARGELEYGVSGLGKEREKEMERDWKGRKCVIRVGFGEVGEWFLDMPDLDVRYDWVKRIKDLAVLTRAEEAGHGKLIRKALATNSTMDLSLMLDQTIVNSRAFTSSSSLSTTASLSQPRTQSSSGGRSHVFPTALEDTPSPLGRRFEDRPLDSFGDSPVGVIDFSNSIPARQRSRSGVDTKAQRQRDREEGEASLQRIEAAMRKDEQAKMEKETAEFEEKMRLLREGAEAKRVKEAAEEWERVQAVKKEMVERYEREKREMEKRFEREKKELEDKYTASGRLKQVAREIATAQSAVARLDPESSSGVVAESSGHSRQRSLSGLGRVGRDVGSSQQVEASGLTTSTSRPPRDPDSPVSIGRRSTVSSTSTGSTRRHPLPAMAPPPSKPLPAVPVSSSSHRLGVDVDRERTISHSRQSSASIYSSTSSTGPLPPGQTITLGEPVTRGPSPSRAPRPSTGTTLSWDRLVSEETDAVGRLRVRDDKTASLISARAFFKDDLKELAALEAEDSMDLPIMEEDESEQKEREMSRMRDVDVATPEYLTPLEEDVTQAAPSMMRLGYGQKSRVRVLGGLSGSMERLESSSSSTHSSGTGTTEGGKKRWRPQTPAMDIMDEFRSRTEVRAEPEEPMPPVERTRVIRFAKE